MCQFRNKAVVNRTDFCSVINQFLFCKSVFCVLFIGVSALDFSRIQALPLGSKYYLVGQKVDVSENPKCLDRISKPQMKYSFTQSYDFI